MNELKQIRDALASIAYRPLGGKTEDYLCSAKMQEDAREALATLDRMIATLGDTQAALDALAKLVGAALFSAKDAHEYQMAHKCNETIRAALTAQQQPANAEIDLDNAREVFENWLTGNGNYPHLKHKSFGGQYLQEEAAMKWDGFKAGYYARAEQKAEV